MQSNYIRDLSINNLPLPLTGKIIVLYYYTSRIIRLL